MSVQPPLIYGNHTKALDAREGYHVFITTNIPAKEMSRQLEKVGWRWTHIVGLFSYRSSEPGLTKRNQQFPSAFRWKVALAWDVAFLYVSDIVT
jgi:hypothetical protein